MSNNTKQQQSQRQPHQILSGTTWHLRRLPAVHKFVYPYRYWGVNLSALAHGDSLPEVSLGHAPIRLFSTQHRALQQFCPDDYLVVPAAESETKPEDKSEYQPRTTPPSATAKPFSAQTQQAAEQAKDLLARAQAQFQRLTASQPSGDIMALVVCRNLGVYFSPVNFYIGFDQAHNPTHLLAEVSNTPWDKRHYYGFLLTGAQTQFVHDKDFHVSPFNPIDQQYRWQVQLTPATPVNASVGATSAVDGEVENDEPANFQYGFDINLGIHVSDVRGEVFAAGISMSSSPMTAASIQLSLRDKPLMTLTSVAQIYWHAFKLFAIKRVPYIQYDQRLADSSQRPSDAQSPRGKPMPATTTKLNARKLEGADQRVTKSRVIEQSVHQHNKQQSNLTPQPLAQNNLAVDKGIAMTSMDSKHDNATAEQSTHDISVNRASEPPAKASVDQLAPTDRRPSSPLEKVVKRLTGSITQNPLLKPVDKGVNQLARKVVRQALSKLQFGQLRIVEAFGVARVSSNFGQSVDETIQSSSAVGDHPLVVTMTIYDPSVYRQLLFGGSIALADSYINAEWDTDDLTGLIRLAARNLKVLDQLEGRFATVSKALERTKHRLRSNDKVTAKSNILAHYDLGNEMYQRFLDPTMMYSSAVYPKVDSSLAEAQQHKLQLICEQLKLSADDQVVEIGTGWGGFAIYAATHYGCHVTTTTISDAQYAEAKRRVEALGLSDKITLLKQDYRELSGHYDKLVSIEMIEAVGHEFLPTFFAKCNALLKPSGRMVLQAITFNDQGYADYLKSVDFIQTHIFPGGCLLSNQEIINRFTEQTDMVVKQLVDYGYDYAHTLRDWRQAFFEQREAIEALGYDEAFMRLWDFYFCYCEGGFLERSIGVVQVTAVKPENQQ